MTIVDRASRCIVAGAVCETRTPELMRSVADAAPHAQHYYSDAFDTYGGSCWWGTHQAMTDKSQTYSVEGTNAAHLRHYLARLARRSRCSSRRIHAPRRVVDLFVRCYNARQLKRRKYPHYPAPLTIMI